MVAIDVHQPDLWQSGNIAGIGDQSSAAADRRCVAVGIGDGVGVRSAARLKVNVLVVEAKLGWVMR